jgi:HlyD family secretion protein
MRSRTLIIASILCLTLLAIPACRKKAATSTETPPVPVMVQKPTVGTITDWYRTTAELVSPLETPLSFALGGRVIELVAKEGDTVTVGQYLGKVDTAVYSAQYQAALSGAEAAASQAQAADSAAKASESQVATAQAAFDQAERDFNRMQTLRDEGVATQSEFERAQLGYTSAQQGLQAAKDGSAAARAQADAALSGVQAARDSASQVAELVDNGTLRAPFSGRIAAKMVDPGTVVGPGQAVYRLIADGDSSDQLEVRYKIPESIIGQVSVGTEADLSLVSLSREIPLRIDNISPEINTTSRTAQCISYISIDALPLLPGMFGSIRVPIAIHLNATILPEQAVIEFTDVKIVYIVQADKAVRRVVTTGLRENGMVEILSGITIDDTVVTVGNRFLLDGAKITIRDGSQGQISTSTPEVQGGNK